ncbi:Maf family protein [Litorivicinus sp.]|nr:Maf family protein [Litorivicinus sp.]
MILASQSPRRRDLLQLITSDFRVIPADIDESPCQGETPNHHVARLAQVKARAVSSFADVGELIIGSDTTVSVDGLILNKPNDQREFLCMMDRLSGKTHQVYSGICVLLDDHADVRIVRTDVTFRELTAEERLHYWQTGEPADKAGGYGIQGLAARFVESIHGSYTNVVGLPLVELEAMLNRAS